MTAGEGDSAERAPADDEERDTTDVIVLVTNNNAAVACDGGWTAKQPLDQSAFAEFVGEV